MDGFIGHICTNLQSVISPSDTMRCNALNAVRGSARFVPATFIYVLAEAPSSFAVYQPISMVLCDSFSLAYFVTTHNRRLYLAIAAANYDSLNRLLYCNNSISR